jgi:hypothetical protein
MGGGGQQHGRRDPPSGLHHVVAPEYFPAACGLIVGPAVYPMIRGAAAAALPVRRRLFAATVLP